MTENLSLFLQKAEECRAKYEKVIKSLQDTEIIKDRKRIIELSQEKKSLENVILPFNEYANVTAKIKEDEKILSETEDEEMIILAEEELRDLKNRKQELVNKIKDALLPEDSEDKKNAVLEIRAGTGGEEAALFAVDLLRMYTRYSESQGWKFEVVDFSKSGMNGYKEIIVLISGGKVYGNLKFESGVHRVQRIPVTESGGRIHTSAVSVAVLPEREEVEININPEDLDIDFYSASGPGGQHVNKASTAVRIEHKPSGIIVACQDERSQHQNREKAMRLLRAKLFEYEQEKADREIRSKRKKMVGSGDRSEKIRTYNFPQNRITDHRINYTKYNLDSFLDGKIGDLVENLRASQKEESHDEIA
ncbi:peptide chain release factor 1 [candidate division WOR-3 bacterium]|nr:peptide chain release factor 1 [candidate division WOR-3 bacterium]